GWLGVATGEHRDDTAVASANKPRSVPSTKLFNVCVRSGGRDGSVANDVVSAIAIEVAHGIRGCGIRTGGWHSASRPEHVRLTIKGTPCREADGPRTVLVGRPRRRHRKVSTAVSIEVPEQHAAGGL